MAETPLINDVSDTSFWVAYYRVRETERPDALFRDPLAQRLVGERGKRISDSMGKMSRYAEWSVVSRTVIIDRFIEQLVRDGVDAVINLGAGLDTRPYRMNLPTTLEWIEADYPAIITHKNTLLEAERPWCRLTRIAVDLTDAQARQAFLAQTAAGAQKVLILTEGVIPYLSQAQVTDLSRDLATQARFTHWITEYFHPNVYRYLKSTVRTARMQNAPFQFYPEDWYGFFRRLGWTEQETRFTGEVALESGRPVPMPYWARLLMSLVPRSARAQALRKAGYVIFRRAEKIG